MTVSVERKPWQQSYHYSSVLRNIGAENVINTMRSITSHQLQMVIRKNMRLELTGRIGPYNDVVGLMIFGVHWDLSMTKGISGLP